MIDRNLPQTAPFQRQRRIRDMEHKISRSVVDYAVEQQAYKLAIGDVRDIADGSHRGGTASCAPS